uniref:DC1 domain-containing protein n=1 Tax=Picea sitchensis TaxID=3332 RepID=A9P0R4_PICSI|nr:unknown [Picea sitchensis]
MAESNRNPTAGDDEEQEEEGPVVLFNATRHEHELLLFQGLPVYTCSGCKEQGANIGYKCNIDSHRPSSSCRNFTLHELCATLPDAYQHPFRSDVSFKFRPKTFRSHRCNACCDVVKGYVFQTERRHLRTELRLHPLCMALPKILDYSGHANHKLKFVTGDLKGKGYACSACDSQIDSGGWRYRCEDVACKVYVDLSCAKIDIFGLSDHGIQRVAPVSRRRSRRGLVPTVVNALLNGAVYALLVA